MLKGARNVYAIEATNEACGAALRVCRLLVNEAAGDDDPARIVRKLVPAAEEALRAMRDGDNGYTDHLTALVGLEYSNDGARHRTRMMEAQTALVTSYADNQGRPLEHVSGEACKRLSAMWQHRCELAAEVYGEQLPEPFSSLLSAAVSLVDWQDVADTFLRAAVEDDNTASAFDYAPRVRV